MRIRRTKSTKRVAVEASKLPECQSTAVLGAFDQVIQASQVPADDAPVADSVDATARANRASVMQLIRVYVAGPTIDRMMDSLKW